MSFYVVFGIWIHELSTFIYQTAVPVHTTFYYVRRKSSTYEKKKTGKNHRETRKTTLQLHIQKNWILIHFHMHNHGVQLLLRVVLLQRYNIPKSLAHAVDCYGFVTDSVVSISFLFPFFFPSVFFSLVFICRFRSQISLCHTLELEVHADCDIFDEMSRRRTFNVMHVDSVRWNVSKQTVHPLLRSRPQSNSVYFTLVWSHWACCRFMCTKYTKKKHCTFVLRNGFPSVYKIIWLPWNWVSMLRTAALAGS